MPTPVLKSFADKTGKDIKEVEKLWSKSVEIAKSKGLKDDAMYAYATGVLKNMLGIKEGLEMKRCEMLIERYSKLIEEMDKEKVKSKFKKANPSMSDEDIDKMMSKVKEGEEEAGKEDGTGPFKGKEGKGKNKKEVCNKDK